jgi:transposase-like protein
MLICVRGYVTYPLSQRHIDEILHERSVFVDHTTKNPRQGAAATFFPL